MMTIGETIKQLRESKQLSQANLANQLGVSRQTVSNWENDKTIPSLDYMKLLADQHGLSLDCLFAVREGELVGEGKAGLIFSRPSIYSLGALLSFALLILSQDSMAVIALLLFIVFLVFLVSDISSILYRKVIQWQNDRRLP